MSVHLTNQFPQLFRREAYAIQLALYDDADLKNVFESLLRDRRISGNWDKEYSIIPVGELDGRKEDEPIPSSTMTMGYTAYGALKIEVSTKTSMSKHMNLWAKKFAGTGNKDPQKAFAGYLADAWAQGVLRRNMEKEVRYFANIFNYGAIPAGHVFFNQHLRAEGLSDIPNSQLIYDARPLFTFADNPHPSYAAGAVIGPTGAATGQLCGYAGTAGAAIGDTGGYFNAFTFPPSYWALKRVMTHFEHNMAFDENDSEYVQTPDVLLVSSFNEAHWREVLNSRFVAYTQANTENVFQEKDGRYRVQLVPCRYLIRNTWFIGKAKSPSIERLYPETEDEPWAYWKEQRNRSYFASYERSWGFMIYNWRYWVGGSVSIDGVTPPNYGADSTAWEAAIDLSI